MKREGNLYQQIGSFRNLLFASRKARKGKRFKETTARFEIDLEKELFFLREGLINKTYQPGKYFSFEIYDPKRRLISAAPFRDRVIHHALCNVIEPIFERQFIFDSYANRKEKGTHRAIKRVQQYIGNANFVLKCDIVKYFPSIDHSILKSLINNKIKCKDTLWLIDIIIDSSNNQEPVYHYFDGDNLFTLNERRVGIPIGNLTSQFFANIYLNPLDHFIKEILRCKYYVRYVDDFVLLHNDKAQLRQWKKEIEQFLTSLRLIIHNDKTPIYPVEQGVPFLGFRIFRNYLLLKKANIKRFKRRMKKYQQDYTEGSINVQKLQQCLQSWIAHSSFGNTHHLRSKLFSSYIFTKG
jgi:retron-type reverse transcriptase